MNSKDAQQTAFRKPKKLLTILSVCFMISLAAFLASPTANAVESSEGDNPPPLVCLSLLRTSSCYVGDEIQWSLGCSGGVAPYTYGFIYLDTEQEIPVTVTVLSDSYFTTALDYSGLFLGDVGHYRFQFFVMDAENTVAYSPSYQYLNVVERVNTDEGILGALTSMIPSLPSGGGDVSTPSIDISDFSIPELSVDDNAWNVVDTGLNNILPASLGALLVPTIIFLFLGRWLNK